MGRAISGQKLCGIWKRDMKDTFLVLVYFVLIQVFVYSFIYFLNGEIPFQIAWYKLETYHYVEDPRTWGGEFDFFGSLGQWDGQWYLKIAESGYGDLSSRDDLLEYAFFPTYPLLIAAFNILTLDIERSAFLLGFLLQPLTYFSVYYVVGKVYSKKVALRAVLLTFLYPFSIVFRGYYSDVLYLLLLIWFVYFLSTKKFLRSALFLAFLNVTRGVGWPLNVLFLFFSLQALRQSKLTLKNLFLNLIAIITPMFAWLSLNYENTGYPFYFLNIRSEWWSGFPFSLFFNLSKFVEFPVAAFHLIYSSQVNVITFILFLLVLVKSSQKMKPEFWWTSLVILLFPFLVNAMNSRFQVVNFPIFVYLANTLNDWQYLFVVLLFWVILLFTSLYFVNWHWVG